MRCHAAEPGAVTSTILEGFTNPSLAGVPGGPSAARKGRCQGAERRGFTDRTEGRGENPAWIMGARARKSGSEERPGTGKTPRWSAGWRGGPIARAAGSPSQVSPLKVRHPALRSLSLSRE